MFTGIVDHVGRVLRSRPAQSGGKQLCIQHSFSGEPLELGESIAHDGVCLTVTQTEGSSYWIDAGPETLERTTIGAFKSGTAVNLERAATLGTRLGGHLVQGHVDGVGEILSVQSRDNAWDLDIGVSQDVLPLVMARGSVTVDGISLTVTGRGPQSFSLSIIPHTWQVTSLATKRAGSKVNVEVDLIARYVSGLLQGYAQQQQPGPDSKITESFLREHGFT